MTDTPRTDYRDALLLRLKAQWADTAIRWPNRPFDPPAREPWIEPHIIPSIEESASLGTTVTRHQGMFWVRIYVPLNHRLGDRKFIELADKLDEIYKNQSFDGVETYAGVLKSAGEEGAWSVGALSIPYRFDNITS